MKTLLTLAVPKTSYSRFLIILNTTKRRGTGKDTFDVETTLKPSDVSLNYTGWHDATVKEFDGNQWNE